MIRKKQSFNAKIIRYFVLFIVLTIFLASSVLALAKPIGGYVLLSDNSTPAVNASVTVYVNNTLITSVNPCRVVPSVYTGTDGGFSVNLNDLKRNDDVSDCSGFWSAGDLIWAEADGSTIVPTAQGNGSNLAAADTLTSGSTTQIISNFTVASIAASDTTPPNINLISPANNSVSTIGNVTFNYNVTDASSIDNCSLVINNAVNQTDTSVTVNITQNFTLTSLANNIYDWKINCSDNSGNSNESLVRVLNVSKVGSLTASLVNPTNNYNASYNDFFIFTSQVNCVGGNCGDVNASLDPIVIDGSDDTTESSSTWSLIVKFLKDFFKADLITGMVAGNLVPTTPSTPFYTNSSNPVDSTSFSCLANMAEGSSCNVTWYVNASGNVGVISEFFAYFNSTTNQNLSAITSVINITIVDDKSPDVFDLIPSAATNFNISDIIEISANATDNVNISQVTTTITYPNTTTLQVSLSQVANSQKYNSSFSIPNLIGRYNVSYFANDTSNNINDTSKSYFIVAENNPPQVFDLIPQANESYNVSDKIEVSANATDNVAIDTVFANITYPNGTSVQLSLGNSGDKYNNSFTIPNLLGRYNVSFIANDTSNNINSSETTFFVGFDNQPPTYSNVTESPTDIATYLSGQNYYFNITWIDNIALSTVFIEFDGINYTSQISNVGNVYLFNRTDLAVGNYNYTWYANDTSGNLNNTVNLNYTINKATPVINLTLNGQDSNVSVSIGSVVNLTGTRISGEGSVKIYKNNTLINTGSPVISNLSTFNSLGTFNITLVYVTTQNYSSAFETYYVIVGDNSPPNVTNVTALPNSINLTQFTIINATVVDDTAVDTVIAHFSFANGSNINKTMSNSGADNYNTTFTTTLFYPIGQYNVTIFANDSSNNLNNSEGTSFIVSDATPPSVFNLVPVANTSFNASDVIEVSANATDNVAIDTVFANITYPNGTSVQLSLGNSGDKYNNSFTIPNLLGMYNISYFANDTSGTINNTETSFFVSIDDLLPSVFDLIPTSGSTFGISDTIEIGANVTDNILVDVVYVNITYPNSTMLQLILTQVGSTDKYNTSFTLLGLTGQYNVTYFANDSSANINNSETSYFTTGDIAPTINLINPSNGASQSSSSAVNVSFTCNATDDNNLTNISIYITNSDNTNFSLNQTTLVSGTSNQTTWNLLLSQGTYTWNCQAFDNANNSAFASSNYSYSITAPSSSGGGGGGGGSSGGSGGGGGSSSSEDYSTSSEQKESEEKPIIEEDKSDVQKGLNLTLLDYPNNISLSNKQFNVTVIVENIGKKLLENVSLEVSTNNIWVSEPILVGDIEVADKKEINLVLTNNLCNIIDNGYNLSKQFSLNVAAIEKDLVENENFSINFNIPTLSVLTDQIRYAQDDVMKLCIIFNNKNGLNKDKLEFEVNVDYGELYLLDYLSPYQAKNNQILVVTKEYVLKNMPITDYYDINVELFQKGFLFFVEYLVDKAKSKVFFNGFIENKYLVEENSLSEFIYNNEKHSFVINHLDDNYVNLTISSKPQNVSLRILDAKYVDLDLDGLDDISLIYLGMTDNKADLRMRLVKKETNSALVGESYLVYNIKGQEVESGNKKFSDGLFLKIILLLLVLVLAVVLVFYTHKYNNGRR